MSIQYIDPCPDPTHSISRAELEAFFIFAVAVPGHNAKTTADAVVKLLNIYGKLTPLQMIEKMIVRGTLMKYLKRVRLGKYNSLSKTLHDSIKSGINLRTCSVEDLMDIYGIGNKTSRFFILHTRPNQRLAVLDVHILKWLRARGITAPRTTPQSQKEYRRLENIFLSYCDGFGMSAVALDSFIWKLSVMK